MVRRVTWPSEVVPNTSSVPSSRRAKASCTLGSQAWPAGVNDISFVLERGSFTVLAGRVGSGKTTILRALLGLVPAGGEVRWNDRLIEDRASFLVPPRSAYTPQIPKLFSDTLAYNISLRERMTEESVHAAAHLAVLDTDLDRLAGGLETVVGARGVKLSGGQVQRSAVARMFATEADLLVFDDLSSALDLHTEAELWERLFEHRSATCLVVSHRPAALQRADQILVVDDGEIVDRGRLDELKVPERVQSRIDDELERMSPSDRRRQIKQIQGTGHKTQFNQDRRNIRGFQHREPGMPQGP